MQTTTTTLTVTLAAALVLGATARPVGAAEPEPDLATLRSRCAPHVAKWRSASASARERVRADMPAECQAFATDAPSAPAESSVQVSSSAHAPDPNAPFRVRQSSFVVAGVRLWDDDYDSVSAFGTEAGVNASKHVAVSGDFATASRGGSRAYALRVGMRAYALPGAISPYLDGRVGIMFGNEAIAVWNAAAGVELALEPSGLLLDLRVGTIGILSDLGNNVRGRISEVSLGVGKRF